MQMRIGAPNITDVLQWRFGRMWGEARMEVGRGGGPATTEHRRREIKRVYIYGDDMGRRFG